MRIIKKIGRITDEIFAEYYFLLLVCLGVFLIINYARVDYVLTNAWNGWSVGDWIINYDRGFIRRGLSGEIFRWVSDLSNIKLNILVYLTQCLIYFIFIFLLIHSLKNKIITFWFFVLCFTPGFLLFTYFDGMAVGRKEIALYAAYVTWINLQISNKINIQICFVFGCLYLLITLMHESFIFYSLYFSIFACLGKYEPKVKICMLFAAPIGSVLAIVMILIFGKTVDGTLICSDFLAYGINKNVCDGVIAYGNVSPIEEIERYLNTFNYQSLKNIILIFSIVMIPNLLFLLSIENTIYSKRNFLIINFLLILISLPLFMIAIDWGRWVSMHITLSVISLLVFLETKKNNNHDMFKKSVSNGTYTFLFVALIIFILSTTLYSVQHCCENNFITLFGPIIKIATTLGLVK